MKKPSLHILGIPYLQFETQKNIELWVYGKLYYTYNLYINGLLNKTPSTTFLFYNLKCRIT